MTSGKPIDGVLAWVGAILIGAATSFIVETAPLFLRGDGVGIGGFLPLWMATASVIGAVVSGPFALLIVQVRREKVARPFAELSIGVVLGLFLVVAALFMSGKPLSNWGDWAMSSLFGDVPIVVNAVVSCCVASLSYWVLAGRPTPPYERDLAHT